jgi:hypothetical protein
MNRSVCIVQVRILHSWCDEQECICIVQIRILHSWCEEQECICIVQIRILHSWCDEQECMYCPDTYSSLLVGMNSTVVYVLLRYVITPGGMRVHILYSTFLLMRLVRRLSKNCRETL